ncbi:MAG: protein-glutamate O-methyltransferase CheR [Sphingomonadales bacterium]|nr:protein-glutamate O-methyltransferase CheR [Sphingomonadales bacterium]
MNAPVASAFERPDLTARDYAALSALVHRETGILLPDSKRELVRSRLAKRLRTRGLNRFEDYLKIVGSDPRERAAALDALTTNHTSFFRESHHFDHFVKEVRPTLVQRAARGERIRLWSSACSSGEEPYSMAMTLLGADRQQGAKIAGSDTIILATDLSPTVIEHARAATYPAAATAAVPRPLASAWVATHDGQSRIDPICTGLVQYRELNLMGDWPIRGMFDVIFCRNVMIYFDEPTKERLQARLVERLVPGGYFYIGHSERLIGAAAESCRPIGQTIYRKDTA